MLIDTEAGRGKDTLVEGGIWGNLRFNCTILHEKLAIRILARV